MKNFLLALATLLLCFSNASAQLDRGSVGFSIGPALVIGDFASKDNDNSDAGFTKSGICNTISFSYRLGESPFGVTTLLSGQAHSYDNQALANIAFRAYPQNNWYATSTLWQIGSTLVGGYGNFDLSPKAVLVPRVMLGVANSTSPELTYTAYSVQSGNMAWVEQNSGNSLSFAYQIGLGASFNVGERISIVSSLDFFGSKPEFVDNEIKDSDGGITFDTWSQRISTFNLSLGLAYRLKDCTQ